MNEDSYMSKSSRTTVFDQKVILKLKKFDNKNFERSSQLIRNFNIVRELIKVILDQFTEFRYLNFISSHDGRNQISRQTLRYQLEMTTDLAFYELADQVTDKKHLNLIMNRQQKFFQTNPYKVQKLYPEFAKKLYSQIINKYQTNKDFIIMENTWQQNQRRVFVWYMIIFADLYSINLTKIQQIKWASLTTIFFKKNPYFLEFQFRNILKSKNKISWNEEEDEILLEAMSKEKPGKWNEVSKRIFYQSETALFKSPKHCRQRWFNHLDQTKNKGSWTLHEDYTVFKFILENGKRWAGIVKILENSRTQHMIKNRYNSLISKLKKNKKKRQEEIIEMVFKSLEAQVKMQRRERKLKKMAKSEIEIKPQISLPEIVLQQNAQKPSILEEQKSENSTNKIAPIKQQEESQKEIALKIEEQQIAEPIHPHFEQIHHLFPLHPFAEGYPPFNPYQFYYMYQQSSVIPFNPMMYGRI